MKKLLLGTILLIALMTVEFQSCKPLDNVQPQVTSEQSQIDALKKRCDSLAAALTSSNNTVLNLTSEILTVTNNQNSQKLSIDSIKKEISGILTSITTINTEVAQENSQLLSLTAQLTQTNANIAAIDAHITTIDGEITTLNNEYASLLAQLNSILTQLSVPSTLSNGLVAYYPFNGNANDLSGNSNNGTVIGATLTSDKNGNPNGAYSFNGSSTYISLPNPFLNGAQVTQFSIYVRFLANISPTYTGNYTLWNKTLTWGEANLQFTSTGKFQFYWANSVPQNSTSSVNTNENLFSQGAWTDVVVNFSNSLLTVYVNGNLVNSTMKYTQQGGTVLSTSSVDPQINFAENAGTNYIGIATISGSLTQDLNGNIDELRVYNRPLTQTEITYLATH